MAERLGWIVENAIAGKRTRASWNDRLIHWERPPSDHEESKIQKAAKIATELVMRNKELVETGVRILPQGSYYNNTNVRLEADMDLRVQLPTLMVRYAGGVDGDDADRTLGYVLVPGTLRENAARVRHLLATDCVRTFGEHNVTVGNKAVSVDGLDGSHADVDLVPAFHLRYVQKDTGGDYFTTDGVGLVAANGAETWNFPDQHHSNGIRKRANTAFRFKRVVRSLKRLNNELCEIGAINRRLPSFLVECLAYLVEDSCYVEDDDDRWARLVRVSSRLQTLLSDQAFVTGATEINEIKLLFHASQAWTREDAINFVAAALTRLTA
jgi:hypothetical protein